MENWGVAHWIRLSWGIRITSKELARAETTSYSEDPVLPSSIWSNQTPPSRFWQGMCPASLQASGQGIWVEVKETFRWYPLKKKTKTALSSLLLLPLPPALERGQLEWHWWHLGSMSGYLVLTMMTMPTFQPWHPYWPVEQFNYCSVQSTCWPLCCYLKEKQRPILNPVHLGIFFYSDLDSCLTRKPSFKGAPFNNLCITYFQAIGTHFWKTILLMTCVPIWFFACIKALSVPPQWRNL